MLHFSSFIGLFARGTSLSLKGNLEYALSFFKMSIFHNALLAYINIILIKVKNYCRHILKSFIKVDSTKKSIA